MTDFQYISAVLVAVAALVPVLIVIATLLFRTGRRRGGDGPGRRPASRHVTDPDGE